MNAREIHARYLRAAEAQFRLATAARLAVTLGHQPLDLPIPWSHGKHQVNYSEIALGQEEADFAAWNLQRSGTFLMASAALEAIKATIQNPKAHADARIANAYQIARMIRNAFSHSPFDPIWRIDQDCRDRDFEVPSVIRLDCRGLDGKPFDWRDYGGPLAILRLAWFVRKDLLGGSSEPERVIPLPDRVYYQQGDLILTKIEEVPAGAVLVQSDDRIELPGGHTIVARGSGKPPVAPTS